ncbi:hypothetical protein [Streptomyces sp. NPDC049585]|uniref:hypothetical protein n=1 Tax=Streptomyces sp. NPDC049585 TaxID=3155154 RepID=UPI00342C61AA
MNHEDLVSMLVEQTPACGPARYALQSGGTFVVWDGLVSAHQLTHTYRTRLRITQKRGQPTLALAETVEILRRAGEEPLRIGRIDSVDGAWKFVLFLSATATTVLACTGAAAPQTTAS